MGGPGVVVGGGGLSSTKSSAAGCIERLAGGLQRSDHDLEGVDAVVVLDGADPEGGSHSNRLCLLLLPKQIVLVRGIALACEHVHCQLEVRTICVDALLQSKPETRLDVFRID